MFTLTTERFNDYYAKNYPRIRSTILKRIPKGVIIDRSDDVEDILQNVYLYFAQTMAKSNNTFPAFENFENLFWASLRRKAITISSLPHYVDEKGLHRNLFLNKQKLYRGKNPEKSHENMSSLINKNKQIDGFASPEVELIKKQNKAILDFGLKLISTGLRASNGGGLPKAYLAVKKYSEGEIKKWDAPHEYTAAMVGLTKLRGVLNAEDFDISVYEDVDWVQYETKAQRYCTVPGCVKKHKRSGFCEYHANKKDYEKKLDKQKKV